MGAISAYEAFEIRLRPTADRNYELLIRSPAGEISIRLDPDQGKFLDEVLTRARRRGGPGYRDLEWGEIKLGDPAKRTPRETGRRLYDIIMAGEARRLFDESLEGLASTPQKGLALRFHFNLEDREEAELSRLPWELLFRQDQARFLAQSIETPVVRYLEMPGQAPRFELPNRLGILLLIAEPRDLPPLDLMQAEKEELQGTWDQDNVRVEVLSHQEGAGDLGARLRERLRSGGPFHVLHFAGHGTFDPETQEGAIFLENAERLSVRIPGEELAGWLINHRSLRLVVLNACSTGAGSGDRPFGGVAPALVRSGLAGALAMQDPIPDLAAAEFARILYQRLADGDPVEAALAEARLEVHATTPSHRDDWATPVLFQRTPKIIQVPQKIGPALAQTWTWLAGFHAVVITLLLFSERSYVPIIDEIFFSSVAAYFGALFALPVYLASLYCAEQYVRVTKLPAPPAEIPLLRRIALRLPVAFATRIQGRRINEQVYQLAFLVLFVIAPMCIQGFLIARTLDAPVWTRFNGNTFEGYGDGVETSLFRIPPWSVENTDTFDRYRLGSIDNRTQFDKPLNNATYFPFWQSWAMLIAEVFAALWVIRLLYLLSTPQNVRGRSGS